MGQSSGPGVSGERPQDGLGPIPTGSLWRQQCAARYTELLSQLEAFADGQADTRWRQAAARHLDEAREAARSTGIVAAFTGAPIQRATHNLDLAELNIYRLAPIQYLNSVLPVLTDEAADVLPVNDSRLRRLTELQAKRTEGLTEADRDAVVAAVSAAKKASLDAHARVRAFRNVVLFAILFATTAAGVVATVSAVNPSWFMICHAGPSAREGGPSLTCPTGFRNSPNPYDALVVMLIGVLGATIAAVFALHKVRGNPDPYSVTVALAMLKLPTGAITAFLAPFLIAGGFVPGWSNFDSPQQFLAWSVLFGYSQELFTGIVDRQAAAVLSTAAPRSSSSV
jgi:hypothetical protein